ncbi:hypothetical protein V1525DRAFT_410951 [Lipomyces kononenkoae]|uniref:Uncharacterized protein n=1 Tax=Lipomyces kononenkoae TaxID=34357 RepID=A0ACC3SVD4_LIPKO
MPRRLVVFNACTGFSVVLLSTIVVVSIFGPLRKYTHRYLSSHNSTAIDLFDKERACVNPYNENGFAWFPETDDTTDATWVPLYEGVLDEDYTSTWSSEKISAEHLYSDGALPRQVLALSPFNWVQALARLHRLLLKSWRIDEDGNWLASETPNGYLSRDELREMREYENLLSWIKNRRLLMVSDSVDRFQTAFFCDLLDQAPVIGQGQHSTYWCHIPYLNVTLMHWHIASFVTSRPPWGWWRDMKVVTVEERWTTFFEPTLDKVVGMNGRSPDLIMVQSGLWDQQMYGIAYMTDHGEKEPDFSRPLNWAELRLYMQRERSLVARLRQQFGNDVPMVYRMSTLPRDQTWHSSLHDINQAARFVARETDMEIMDFGNMLHGHDHLYFDGAHLGPGALSIWANMWLWYLFRGQGGVEVKGKIMQMPPEDKPYYLSQNWNFCHEIFVNGRHKRENPRAD